MSKKTSPYSWFARIDGGHPLRSAVPDGFVDYTARTRQGGKVFYFNFDLAKEMGLLNQSHPEKLNKDLNKAILDTFSIQIINEYDLEHGLHVPEKELKPARYMATRYLQLQHPDRKGLGSGDGRSVWNGHFRAGGTTWDVSSCGTGVTALCPATAHQKKFFKTGDKMVSYGCGRSDLVDGVCAAVMSDIFYRNNIPTERTLAVIAFGDNTSINVRVSQNLFRPAHIFYHLKQGDYQGLKSSVDYYIDRQVGNGHWPEIEDGKKKYRHFLERVADNFARSSALFESEYIFCWLDWDGDNILADGSILDYGSVRQFGLYHHEYRYDDVDRMSTTITEQRKKAKYIVQTFAQACDFLVNKKKRPIGPFRSHVALKRFDREFAKRKDWLLGYKIGLSGNVLDMLIEKRQFRKVIGEFRKHASYFEKQKSCSGPHEVADGITWDAIFCLRDLLRELPLAYRDGQQRISDEDFIDILKSNYALADDLILTRTRKQRIREFQDSYWKIIRYIASSFGVDEGAILKDISNRVIVINRADRVTGDAILDVAEKMVKSRARVDFGTLYSIHKTFVDNQVLLPECKKDVCVDSLNGNKVADRLLKSMRRSVEECREGI